MPKVEARKGKEHVSVLEDADKYYFLSKKSNTFKIINSALFIF